MWICLPNAFMSIVQDKNDSNRLVARARASSHLYSVFGSKANVIETTDSDYRYRVFLTREEMAMVLSDLLLDVDYDNFKAKTGTVDPDLAEMYGKWWYDHYKLQEKYLQRRKKR